MTSPSLMAERTGTTNSQGVFIARLLPPGNYTIEVIAGGFQTARTTRNIGMDQHFQPRIVMQTVAGATVEVIATASSAVDPTSVQTSSNYDAKKIDELPTGRDVVSVAMLSPGVVQGHGANDVSVRGSMGSSNLFLMDGQNLMDNVFNSFGFSFINDSFEETQVITGAISAEYGNVDGGVINMLTKSGGNKFTGMVRVDLSNPAWNATRPWTRYDQYGLALNRPDPTPQPNASNTLSEVRTYTLGGYFWKDKIWFHFSMQDIESVGGTGAISSLSTAPDRGQPWTRLDDRKYYIGKLTYLINQDHTLVGTYSWNGVDLGPYANVASFGYNPGEAGALGYQTQMSWMYNLSWRAIWAPNFNTEARFGAKRLMLDSGGSGDVNNINDSVIFDDWWGLIYNKAYWRKGEPEYRDNQTANLKGSYFLDWHGTHELDFGVDYYKGTIQSPNAQGPTDYVIHVLDYDHETKTGVPYYLENYIAAVGDKAEQQTIGLYINDKWKLNNNWSFQVGLRWDQYKADATDVSGQIASSSGFSPRLGVTYDLFGDQQWIFKASWCRYNGAVIESLTGVVSGASGNPLFIGWYSDIGRDIDDGSIDPDDVIGNPAYYVNAFDLSQYTIRDAYDDPLYGTEIDSSLKNPYADEFQISASYSFITNNWGRGYVSLTAVQKEWGNLIDYSIGNNGWLPDPTLGPNTEPEDRIYIRRWANQPLAKRKYQGLELVADWSMGNLHVGGNITWSSLKGNYEGEAANQPGRGQGIDQYRMWRMNDEDPVREMFDYNFNHPYGYLARHKPLYMSWNADYVYENKFGRTVFGFMYTLQSGDQYSYTRNIRVTAPGLTNGTSSSDSDILWRTRIGGAITQYKDGQRTHGSYNTLVYHDLAITHDFNLFKVFDYQVTAFAKLTIYNFFNHMQISTWRNSYAHATVSSIDAPWVPANTAYMGAVLQANYANPRRVLLSAGIRF